MPVWLLLGLTRARSTLSRAWGWITASSTHLLIVALAGALLFGVWERHSLHRTQAALSACQSGRKADRASYVAAQQEALKQALAAKAAQEAAYREKAKDADNAKDQAVAAQHAADLRFIAAHRLPDKAAGGAPGGTVAAPNNSPAGLLPDLSAVPVVVSGQDVSSCSEWVSYGIAARNWALSLAH